MDPELPVIEQKESIKLIKNSKGYNWEIRIFKPELCGLDQNPLEVWINRLEDLNTEMKRRFEKTNE